MEFSGVRINVVHSDGSFETIEQPTHFEVYTIGRGPVSRASNSTFFVVKEDEISRRHCRIRYEGDGIWILVDLDSTNGTFCDGRWVHGEVPIDRYSRITIGGASFQIDFSAWLASEARINSSASIASDEVTTQLEDGTTTVRQDDTEETIVMEIAEAKSLAVGTVCGEEDDERTVFHFDPDAAEPEERTVFQARTHDADQDPETALVDDAEDPSSDEFQAAAAADRTVWTRVPSNREPVRPLNTLLFAAEDASSDAEVNALKTTAWASDTAFEDTETAVAGEAQDDVSPAPSMPSLFADMVAAHLVDESQIVAAREQAVKDGDTIFEAICQQVSSADLGALCRWAADRVGIELIDDARPHLDRVRPLEWLTADLAKQYSVVALEPGEGEGEQAVYGVTNPFDVLLDDWISRYESNSWQKVALTPPAFKGLISQLSFSQAEDQEEEIGLAIDFGQDEESEIRRNIAVEDVPVIVDYLLFRAYDEGASDVHVEPTEDGILVRIRIDGILHEETELPIHRHAEISSRIKILAEMDVAEKRRPQDGRISARIKDKLIDVRVSTFPTVFGEKVVMRLLDRTALRPSPEQLGLTENDLISLMDNIGAPYGLIMLCGPTGSGKTTTLYSCLGAIDKAEKNVLTVEDPVEYRLKGIHQMNINHKIGLTFASGLRTILRQDPDVIMIGECRDGETAGMAIEASLTGHIVFSTIHTNDSVGVVSRLIDMGVDSYLVATALTVSIAQRLVRTLCPHCKSVADGAIILDQLMDDGVSRQKIKELNIDIDPETPYVRAVGCQQCRHSGYIGRQAVFELFEMTSEGRAIVVTQNFNSDQLRQVALENGMTTLVQSGLRLVDEGATTHAEVIKVLGESG